MRRSTDRILVSHAGTLPRSDDVARPFADGPDDEFRSVLPGAIKEVVRRQADLGIDIVNDGEFSKRGGGKSLMPGVVGHASNVVEHPETVADRLVRYAGVVGRENVIAGTDCGIGTRVGHSEIAWAKLEALVEGARIASKTLWS
jgi:methionine synthase II (cobalamin-independent)